MKICELHQRAFGRFADHELIFGAGSVPGLHVVYGPNEAGKTTTLYAIRYGLYGIPDLRNDPRTYDFLHRKPDLRIAMVVESASGKRIAFTRRKKTGETCFDFSDAAPAPDAQQDLDALLRGVDHDLFARKYGIDQRTLREGGEGLADESKSLGESLFAAETGIVGIHHALEVLADQVDGLLKHPGRSGAVVSAAKRFTDADAAVRRARRAGGRWHPKQYEVARRKDELEDLRNRVMRAEADRSRAEAIMSAVAQVIERDAALEEIESLGSVIEVWSQNQDKRLRQLHGTIAGAAASLATAKADLEVKESRRDELLHDVDENLLLAADRVQQLAERIAEYVTAKGSAAQLLAARSEAELAVAGACRAVDADADPAGSLDLIPPLAAMTAARAHLAEHEGVSREASDAATALDDAEEELKAFDGQAASTSAEPRDLGDLRAAVSGVERVDTTRLAQLEQNAASKQRQLADSTQALPRSSHGADALLALSVPLDPTVEQFDTRLQGAHNQVDLARDALRSLDDRRKDREDEITRLTQGQDLPTEDELTRSRERRDGLWHRIRAAWLGGPTNDDSMTIAAGTEPAAAERFDAAVRESDDYADRRVAAGEIAGKLAAVETERDELAAETTQKQADLQDLQTDLERAEAEWRAVWERLDVEPGTVAEMRSWLTELRSIRTSAEALDSDRTEAEALRERVERARRDLSAALITAQAPPASDDLSVEVLEARAKELLDEADETHKQAIKRKAEREALETNRNRAEHRLRKAQRALKDWTENWAKAAPTIGLLTTAPVQAGYGMLDAIDALETKLGELQAAASRYEGNDATATAFENDMRELLKVIGGGLAAAMANKPADQVVRELARATKTSQSAAEALETIEDEIETYQTRQREYQDTINAAQAEMVSLATEAGLASPDELDAAALRWTERETHREAVRAAEQRIIEITRMTPADVVAFLEKIPSDQLPVLIADLENSVADLNQELEEKQTQIDGLQEELGELRVQAQLEDALADREDARADVERLAAKYTQVKLEHDILANYLRDKATVHIGPALTRAGELFKELTCGEYLGLMQDVDANDKPILKVTSSDRSAVDRSGLSSGTSDQLYLALRLASIYQQLEQPGQEPIPFIVDDVLTTFDDGRSTATIHTLSELAKRTQVIFFTHHHHLVDLARAVVPEDVLHILELA